MPYVIGALAFLALAYRLYYSFVATKVLMLNDQIEAPSFRLFDKHNYYPMPKWVVFGHHFAAIAGAGPLVGPVLAAQFGFMPGFIWMLVGAVMAGAMHDVVILTASVRHDGKSLAEIAKIEISQFSGSITSIAVLIILVIALAGLGVVVVNALAESSWGTFTIAMTIPIAIFMGLWMFKFRKGRTVEATVIGVILLSLAVIYGKYIPGSPFESWFTFNRNTLTILLAAYGFIASVLPVWLLTFSQGLPQFNHEIDRHRITCGWDHISCARNQNAKFHPIYPWWRTDNSRYFISLLVHYYCLRCNIRISCLSKFRNDAKNDYERVSYQADSCWIHAGRGDGEHFGAYCRNKSFPARLLSD